MKMGMSVVEGDAAFYYLHDGIKLKGMVITHVDDFTIAGEEDFVKNVVEKVQTELTISKVEHGSFRFTGVDVRKSEERIEISMEDYVESIEPIKTFRNAKKSDPLLPSELKVYRG